MAKWRRELRCTKCATTGARAHWPRQRDGHLSPNCFACFAPGQIKRQRFKDAERSTCTTCGVVKPRVEFRTLRSGYRQSWCIPCDKARKVAWRRARGGTSKAEYTARQRAEGESLRLARKEAGATERASRREAERQARAEWAAWLKRAPEWWRAVYFADYWAKCRARSKRKYWANPDAGRLKVRAYKASHPDVVARNHSKRWARIKDQADGTVTDAAVRRLLAKAKRCAYCSVTITTAAAHIDHIIPVSRGGAHAMHNLAVTCERCNLSKSGADPMTWVDGLPEAQRRIAERAMERARGAPLAQGLLL